MLTTTNAHNGIFSQQQMFTTTNTLKFSKSEPISPFIIIIVLSKMKHLSNELVYDKPN